MAEAQRIQGAEAAGKQFMFNAREEREAGKINRVAGQMGIAGAQEQQANADYTGALTGMIGGITSAVGTVAQGAMSSSSGAGGLNAPKDQADTSSGVGYKFGSAGGGFNSDRRLKKNINKIGVSPSGINIYSFEYNDINLLYTQPEILRDNQIIITTSLYYDVLATTIKSLNS
jgi:hypothetical protein